MQAKPNDSQLTCPSDCKIFILLAVILGCCLAISSFLTESLWLDESISAWVSSNGLATAISRSWNFQGQSPLFYLLLSVWIQLLGSGEFALRLFSLLIITTATLSLFSWIKSSISLSSAFIACTIFICLDPVLLALSARPYALGILFTILAVKQLSYFALQSNIYKNASHATIYNSLNRHPLLRFWLFGSLAIYSHYFAALSIFSLGVVTIIALQKNKRAAISTTLALTAIVISSLPLYPHYILLRSKAAEISFAPAVSLTQAVDAFLPIFPIIACLIACVAASTIKRMPIQKIFTGPLDHKFLVVFAFAWFVLPPLALLILSLLSGSSLMIPRYLSFSIPGFALLVALGFSTIEKISQKRIILILVSLLSIRELNRNWAVENWRESFSLIANSKGAVLLASGLAESNHLNWLDSKKLETQQYLRSPALYYRQNLPTTLIPSALDSKEQRDYFQDRLLLALKKNESVQLIFLSSASYLEDISMIAKEVGATLRILQGGRVSVVEIASRAETKNPAVLG